MDVEQRYRTRLAELRPHERVARAFAMAAWARDFLARRIREEMGEVSPERLKWEVARRLYGSESGVRLLIEERLRDVAD